MPAQNQNCSNSALLIEPALSGLDVVYNCVNGIAVTHSLSLPKVYPSTGSVIYAYFTCRGAVQVGDGTTTVVILAGEFLRESKPFVEEGVHPQSLIRSFRQAGQLAVQRVKDLSISIEGKSAEEKADMLKKCAMTSLNSKLVSFSRRAKHLFAVFSGTATLAHL